MIFSSGTRLVAPQEGQRINCASAIFFTTSRQSDFLPLLLQRCRWTLATAAGTNRKSFIPSAPWVMFCSLRFRISFRCCGHRSAGAFFELTAQLDEPLPEELERRFKNALNLRLRPPDGFRKLCAG